VYRVRVAIDAALDRIEAELQEEGRRILSAVRGAVRALAGRDVELADEVVAFDDEIDRLFLDVEPDSALLETLVEMGERAEEMFRVALDSFARRDLAGAESLVGLDELNDRANRRFVERLVDVMAEPSLREWGLRMVVVARTIERIGDRAVDIGEQTAYLLTAQFREFTDASHPARQT
jgi:phosphate uptake regulator